MKAGSHCRWHRDGKPPRPVVVESILSQKVRVIDLCEADSLGLPLRHDVMPSSLSVAEKPHFGGGAS